MIHNVPNQPLGIRQRVPILGQQQQPTQQQQEQMARMQIMQAVNDMAVGMYVQLAVAHVATRDQSFDQEVDVEHLRPLAKKCMTAAKAFFEGIGVFQATTNSEVEPGGRED
jgi:hypothetical protein